MMFRMGGAEAFARQHVSMADNRQNDTRPIQPSQPPMASQIHPESHRPIADSPEWHGGGRPCDQCGEATEQFQVIVLVKQIAKITDGLVHVLVSAPIVPDTVAALVMRAQVAVEHQSAEDAVQPLDGDASRPVVRVRIQTGETFGDRQSDGRGLDLEEPYRLAERKIVGQHSQRDLAVVVFHAMADIRLAAIVAPVARVAVQLRYPLEDLVDQRHGARTAPGIIIVGIEIRVDLVGVRFSTTSAFPFGALGFPLLFSSRSLNLFMNRLGFITTVPLCDCKPSFVAIWLYT